MKTQVFTFVFNRPDLFKKQIEFFRRNFVGEYQLNAVCDYRDDKYLNQFKELCEEEGVSFYPHKSQDNLSPSYYHGSAVTWAYENVMLKEYPNDYALLLDHDMFLIDEFNLEDYMEGFDVSGCVQSRGDITYVWPGLTIIDIAKTKDISFNFLPCAIGGQQLDTGGGTYFLLKELTFKPSQVEYPDTFNGLNLLENDDGYGFELHLEQKFLHFRNACSWHNNYNVSEKSKKIEALDFILNGLV